MPPASAAKLGFTATVGKRDESAAALARREAVQVLVTDPLDAILEAAASPRGLSDDQALALAGAEDTGALMQVAATLRDSGFGNVITYSRKVFVPLTQLCRDVCHYCTFARTPKRIEQPFMSLEQVLEVARAGARLGCKEALFTLGEKPELRYPAAREALEALGLSQANIEQVESEYRRRDGLRICIRRHS